MNIKLSFQCLHKGCNAVKHKGLGYCEKHYIQFKKHGETFSSGGRDFNEVIDKGNHYELILTDKHGKETGRAKIDKEDLERVKSVGRWCLHSKGYAFNNNKKVYMHRCIIQSKSNEDIDHIKVGIKYRTDNRKKNLRVATRVENSFNRGKQRNNASGFKGVFWFKASKKWQAQITIEGKKQHLGLFNTPEEASKAYETAAKKLHGKFYNKETRQ